MYRQFTLQSLSPSILLEITHFFADWKGTCLLLSGGDFDTATHSRLGLFPYMTATINGCDLSCQNGKDFYQEKVINPWDSLQDHFFSSLLSKDPRSTAFGWFGYEMGMCADFDIKLPYRSSSTPDAYWQCSAIAIELEHQTRLASVTVNLSAIDKVEEKARGWVEKLATVEGWHRFLKDLFVPHINYTESSCSLLHLDSSERRLIYIDKIEKAQELIREGEIYQVNLSQNFEFRSIRHPFSFFRQLYTLNPSPFSVYFQHDQVTIVSNSPERFLSKRDQVLETRPIKGTMQRGKTVEEDLYLKECLLASPKERAELLMITDLMRNDLGKVSEPGSVQTLELWRCEAFANVYHLLSVIRSKVKSDLKPLEIIRSCFPGGSITGCPKLRSMEVIDDLENRPRGIYTGSIGYLSGKGDFDLNIAIRTLIKNKDCFNLQLGGGIVIDSDPQKEYQETLHKGASFFQILHTQEVK